MPKVMKKADRLIAGGKVNNDFLRSLEEASKKLANTPNETVEIVAHDGERLVGHYIPCENPKRIIIAVHGWRSSWHSDFGLVADFGVKISAVCSISNSGGKTTAAGSIWGSV